MLFRIIPTLLSEDGDLVKSKKFKNNKYVGDPINAVKIFNEKEVDELIFLDIQATKHKREPNFELIDEIASECFMPLSYGGGIKTMEHIDKILSLGIEKIVLNSIINDNNKIVSEASKKFGSQFLIASLDFKKDFFGKYGVYNYINKKFITKDIPNYIKFISSLGFGEIYINNVDNDGMINGFDFKLVNIVIENTNLPVVACGGLKGVEDIKGLYKLGCSGVSAGSYFIFQGVHRAVLISYPNKDLIEKFLNSNIKNEQ